LREKILEFYEWLDKSEKELRKRYELEKQLYEKTKKDTDNYLQDFI